MLHGCFWKTVCLEVEVKEECNHGAHIAQSPCSEPDGGITVMIHSYQDVATYYKKLDLSLGKI
jgi:hypothetical protein